MEATNTELIYAMFAVLAASIVGGLISWKLICKKEEERDKECKTIEKTFIVSRLKWSPKALFGFFLVLFPSYACILLPSLMWNSSSPHQIAPMIVWALISIMILISVVGMWLIAFMSPLFAITNDSFILWNYYGYARSEKYLLSELTRKEYEEASRGGDNHVVALYRGEKRIKKLYTNAYKDEKTLLELIRQIPQKEE